MNCKWCGATNRDTARFCATCHAPMVDGIQIESMRSGQKLSGRYEVRKVLGVGAMGTVYGALDGNLSNKRVAIKEYSPTRNTYPAEQKIAAEMFEEEANMLVRLDHPNMTRISDYFREGANQYMVMDYIDGITLEGYLSQYQRVPEPQVIQWGQQIADALQYLHSQNPPIIFRDMKPSNVMIDRQKHIKLIDFGIARKFKPGKAQDTQLFGTPGYAPPEGYGKGQTDARSDVYSLAVTLYVLVSGFDPSNDPFNLPPLRSLVPTISPTLERAIEIGRQLRADQRWQTMEQMIAALSSSQYLPSSSSQLARFPIEGVTIPLVCTLEEAKSEIFVKTRGARILNITNTIFTKQQITTAQTFMLCGQKGFGGTTIAESIRDKIIETKEANLVALIILPEQAPVDSWAAIIEEILRGLRQGAGTINQKLQKTVEKYHREYITRSPVQAERGEQAEIELSLPQVPTPLGGLSIGRIRRSQSSQSKPQEIVLDEKQRGQLLLNALRDLVDYLISEKARVVLIIDKVSDIKTLEPLKSLTSVPNVFTITVVDKGLLDIWQADPSCSSLLSYFGKMREYFPCVWEMPRDLCRRLSRGVSQADNHFFERFIRYIQFKGHGLPDATIKAISPFYTNARDLKPISLSQRLFQRVPENKPFLQITEKEDIQMIFAGAEIDDLLNNHWEELLKNPKDNSRVLGRESVESVKTIQYAAANWLFEKGLRGLKPSFDDLVTHAKIQIGASDEPSWIIENLLGLLEREKICAVDGDKTISLSQFLTRHMN